MTAEQLDEILRRARAELSAVLGDKLDSVLLYGSRARGDARPYSDIDLLIVLHGPFNPSDVRRRTATIASRLSLEYDTVVSRAFATREQYEHERSPFMLNVRDEAVIVLPGEPQERGQGMTDALSALSAHGDTAPEIPDPSEWQRQVRRDRTLPGRES